MDAYDQAVSNSWVKDELWAVRNVHPSFHKVGPIPAQLVGMAYSGLETFILKGRGSWTFRNAKRDSEATRPESACKRIEYPKPDGEVSFDPPQASQALWKSCPKRSPKHYETELLCILYQVSTIDFQNGSLSPPSTSRGAQ